MYYRNLCSSLPISIPHGIVFWSRSGIQSWVLVFPLTAVSFGPYPLLLPWIQPMVLQFCRWLFCCIFRVLQAVKQAFFRSHLCPKIFKFHNGACASFHPWSIYHTLSSVKSTPPHRTCKSPSSWKEIEIVGRRFQQILFWRLWKIINLRWHDELNNNKSMEKLKRIIASQNVVASMYSSKMCGITMLLCFTIFWSSFEVTYGGGKLD